MGARNIVSDDEEEYEEEEVRDTRDTEAADDEEEDEEDAEEEGQDEYEKDGFIVDDVEEEEEEEVKESSDEEMKAKKKKRKKRDTEENYELDEDDYELLQEANVTGFHRPKSGSKKFKRLKKAGRNADIAEEKTGFSDEDDLEEGGHMGSTAEEKLKRSLFGDDEGVPPEDVAEEEEQPEEEEEEDLGEEDEMADFIVDEEEVDENGLPVRRKKSKKRMPRQAPGISSSALQEAQDIFGDVDELLSRRKQGLRAKGVDGVEGVDDEGFKRLEDEFEPSILAEKYMTAKDDQIRETDVPERFQLSEEISGPVPHNENTVPEAKWIYEQAFGSLAVPMRAEFQHIAKLDKEEVVKEISNVLQMFHDQKLEVSFIAMYRKEKCLNLLQDQEQDSADSAEKDEKPKLKMYKALWAIQLWDRKWLLLQRRKNALKASYEKRAAEEARRDENKLNILESVLQSLDDAESERTVDDIDAKFNLHFPPDEVEVEEGQFKRPKRKSLYSICRKCRLGGLSQKFSLSSEQLGENLQLMYKKHEVDDASVTPEDVAAEFSVREFGDSQSVLKGARHMAAVEISCEPTVKEYARSVYMEKALVTTRPTTDGDSAIDSFHQYAGVKWLVNKPISMFDDAQWLLIQKAEEEKLLQVTIGLPKEVIDDLMGELESHYLSDGVSRAAQLWNEQRKLIVKEALSQYILPNMEKEARMVLTTRAKSWLVQDYGMKLWTKASVAPYKRQKRDEEHPDEDSETRVMACCQGSIKDPTTFVMLDSSGEVLDTLFTSHFSIRSKNPAQMKRKEIDQQRFLKFMMDHQPHVVALGASNIYCKHLKDGIYEAIFKIVEEHPREFTDGLDTLNVVYGDVVLPSLYEKSRISQDQLPTQKGLVRRATALGRYLQNPLAMVATLCGPGREILSLKLHSLEHFLNPDERYEAIEQVMVTITNQVGVDINLAASHEWMFSPLQFVSGLGPRKAASLQRAILRAGRINTRRELLTTLGAMKRLVFINAAGFLRVRGTGQAATGNHVMDPLDDTRIHPESYELAKKMAEDVYCEDLGQDIEDMDEEAQEMAIEHVKSNPHVLKALDIDEYARSVEQRIGDRKNETLSDIKIELLQGFQEWRTQHKQPTQDEEFYLLTGESEETLSEGKIVQATVRFVQNNRVICDLESGLTGMVIKEELSDDRDIDPIEKITEGSILTCRVKSIQKAKYLVDLTCKASELRGDHWQNGQIKDPFYAKDESLLHSEQEKAKKEKELAKKSFKSRMIVHPRFQNISAEEAMEVLSDKDAGESVIRPSYRGPSYLTLTLKVCDGVYAHKDIVEGGKDHRDFTTYLRLGKTQSIGEDTFEDLDEVIDRYVDPLVSNLKAILAYRKFRRGTKAEVDDVLRKEKYENPTRIPYYLSVSHEHPVDKYVEVEQLDGDNKYHAEQYGLQDARKGVLFLDFPPVLQLQLKRFEYDFTRDTMVKINDRYEFPLQLDLDRDNGKYLSPDADRSVRNLYTLHSVLVHSGGVHGGHYYAFIRPTLSDQWYKFDDERVTKEEIKRALEEQYGGEEELPQPNPGLINSPGFINTPFKFTKYSNAYMLVYIRESDKDKIICNVDEKDIAEHLRVRLKKEQEEKEKKRKEKTEAHLYTVIKVARDEDLADQIGKDIYFDLVDHDKVRSFRVQKQEPFTRFKEEAAKEFGIPLQYLRFWLWAKRQNHTYRPNRPLTPLEESQSVGHLREVSSKVQSPELKLFMEVKRGPDLCFLPPPEKKKDDILLFFKLYDPEKGSLRYVGRSFEKAGGKPADILPKINEMAGFPPDTEIELYEEIKFEPCVMCERIDKRVPFRSSQIEDGDIICFQKALIDEEGRYRYPHVRLFLEYVRNRQIVHFRRLDKPKEDDFCLELSKLDTYDDVVKRVANQLGLDDPSKLRLTSHNCYSQQPKPQPIKHRGVDHLSDMLVHYNQISDILYYEVLDIPLSELQGLKSLKVTFHHAMKDEISVHVIRLPKHSTVGDVLNELKTKVELSNPNAELRLLEVFYHKIYKIFPINEKIENINDQYWTLRAEEIPEEERNLSPGDRLIHVYHFTKDSSQNHMIQNFGEPFFFVIHEGEMLSEVKERIKKKLQVTDEEFAKWKFAFLSLGRPEYLQDADIVSHRFQRRDVYGAWEQYLGLEHSDNTSKRIHQVSQNRHSFERSVKIYN